MILGFAAVLAGGCASAAGTAKPIGVASAPESLTRYTKVAFVTSAEGAASTMTAADRERIVTLVVRKLNEQAPSRKILGKSEVTKTFAWGGIYGGATGIKDVEEGFAEAVVQVILGQPAQPAGSTPGRTRRSGPR